MCGQVEAWSSNVAPSISPGCCTAKNSERLRSVMSGPHASAPRGIVTNCCTWPRSEPTTGTRKMPSLEPSTLPSVEIHRLPAESKATLSGQLIGLTWALS